MNTPNSHIGLDVRCERCGKRPGQRCVSRTGRVLKQTHEARFRASMAKASGPVRDWFAAQMAGRLA